MIFFIIFINIFDRNNIYGVGGNWGGSGSGSGSNNLIEIRGIFGER